jgi:V/A-type H+-transporting ATPase subunit I
MFTPEKMIQLHIIFPHSDGDRVAGAVVSHGGLQMLEDSEMESWARELTSPEPYSDSADLKEHLDRVQRLLGDIGLTALPSGISPHRESWQMVEPRIREMEERIHADLGRVEEIDKELNRIREWRTRIEQRTLDALPISAGQSATFLCMRTGNLPLDNLEDLRTRLKPLLHMLSVIRESGGRATVVIVALKQDEVGLDNLLTELRFQPLTEETGEEAHQEAFLKTSADEIRKLEQERQQAKERIRHQADTHGGFLWSVYLRLRKERLQQKIVRHFRKTESTTLLSGWVPLDLKDSLVSEIRRVTQNRCIVEAMIPETLSGVKNGRLAVPVQLKNPKLFKPFEILTRTYGMPVYKSIDPTPLLGISFLLMFGIMFGDLGHGLVLTAGGAWMAWKAKRQSMKQAGLLIVYAGLFSCIFGLLFGSFFGLEELLPAIWLKPMESITHLFRFAIYFGIGMITLALGLNIVNAIRQKDFLGAILDKAGLLAMVLYWCGIVTVTRMLAGPVEEKGGVPAVVTVLIAVSLLLLFLREPIMQLLRGRRKLFPEGVATGVMGGAVEILEILLGFLANTVSFIRVAAFGLAHAGLFMAIFALSDAVHNGMVSALVLFFGNVLIICLEGLVVSIQAVRLEFYEFFSRFFSVGGKAYQPLGDELKA